MATENLELLNQWIDKITTLTNIEINTFDSISDIEFTRAICYVYGIRIGPNTPRLPLAFE